MSKYVRQEKSQRKHPVASSSSSLIKPPVIPANIKGRPEWKGPGFVKKTQKQVPRPQPSSSTTTPNIQKQHLPIELQQLLLNIFRTTFPLSQDYDKLKPILQEIRNAVVEGRFESVVADRGECLDAYTVRWSPSRALLYSTVLAGLCEEFGEELLLKRLRGIDFEDGQSPVKVVSFGGGAADLMAFAALLRHIRPESVAKPNAVQDSTALPPSIPTPILDFHSVDAIDWTPVISSLETGLFTPPILSKYASASAKANNIAFLSSTSLNTSFHQLDLLTATQENLSSLFGPAPTLITLFFTLNELHTTSITKTTAFLLKLTLATAKDSLLLVIDTPDSELPIEKEKEQDEKLERKRYPMYYLLDLFLTEKHLLGQPGYKPRWEKLVENRSCLFKFDEKLRYPISLENIRFQGHFFRRL